MPDSSRLSRPSERRPARAIPALVAAILFVVLTVGCQPGLRSLEPGQSPPGPAVGLGHALDLARGALTYAAAFVGDDRLLTIELELDFFLVLRKLGPRGATELWRARLGRAEYDVEDLAIDSAGTAAWVASRDGTIRAISLGTGRIERTWRIGSSATAVAISPDDRYLAIGAADGIVCLRRVADGALLQCMIAHQGQVSGLAFDPAGARLASSSWDGRVFLWRVPSLAFAARRAIPGSANAIAFSPDGRHLAIAASTRPPIRTPAEARREADGALSPREPGNAVYLWAPGADPRALRGHRGPVTQVAWTPDGARILSASWDRAVRMWEARPGLPAVEIARFDDFSSLSRALAVAPGGRLVAAGAFTQTLEGRSLALLHLLY